MQTSRGGARKNLNKRLGFIEAKLTNPNTSPDAANHLKGEAASLRYVLTELGLLDERRIEKEFNKVTERRGS